MCVCVCVCVCVRACVRACVRVCVCVCNVSNTLDAKNSVAPCTSSYVYNIAVRLATVYITN